jgi:pSer/pThr/pTyr-binding forkhead associated (FHA) protein
MVQLRFLSGSKAGVSQIARRFPVRIGRSADSDIQLDDAGVWDQHLEIGLKRGEGFVLQTRGLALAAVNSHAATEPVLLRNGDTIELGAARIQFWLAPPRQKALALREWLTWTALATISLSQIALIYFVLD